MVNLKVLIARLREESLKLPPIVLFADEMFKAGLVERDINWDVMRNELSSVVLLQFRNRLRDLEIGIRKVGDKL
jgi:hypothetical protein